MTIGLYGKLPAHGDFVRRHLPDSFVLPWDEWLQQGILAARDALADGFESTWDAAPPWRFRLPAFACGPDALAGVLVPSQDQVGRRFPLTLALPLAPDDPPPAETWYAEIEATGCAARDAVEPADAVLALLARGPWPAADAPAEGWWMADGRRWDLPALPAPDQFRILLEGGA